MKNRAMIKSAVAETETPLMKQYFTIKAKYPDAILLFRVGDFYETFGEDAIRASKILNIVLTRRAKGRDEPDPGHRDPPAHATAERRAAASATARRSPALALAATATGMN